MRTRSWTIEQIKDAVKNSSSYRQVLQKLHLREAGGNYEQLKKYIKELKLDIKHFTGKGWNKGMTGIGKVRIATKDILVNDSFFQSYKLKKRLFKEGFKKCACELCGWSQKAKDGRVPLELDHMNGNRRDNRLKNLRILCPNCHSLQPTHRGKNIRKNK